MLRDLIKEHGNSWKLIGDLLNRTQTNVRDKWKQLQKKNPKAQFEFNITNIHKLLRAIEEATSV